MAAEPREDWGEGFRDRLSRAMGRAKTNQRGLAEVMGIDESNVSKWMNKTVPRTPTIERLARALGVKFDWLLGVAGAPMEARPDEPTLFPRHAGEEKRAARAGAGGTDTRKRAALSPHAARAIRRAAKQLRKTVEAFDEIAKLLPDEE